MIRWIRTQKHHFSKIVDYARRGRLRADLNIEKGQILDTFQLQEKQYYKDFAMRYYKFINKQNQVQQYHHFDCSQEVNTLALIFQTPNTTKSALNYAVQKMIQCGSKKYPIRNLTNQMVYRSFNPVNSIITSQQHMMFTFQTHCIKDFTNLLQVYFSMVFHPMMKQQDFQEVIHRLVFENNNPKGKLLLSGQLVKEMEFHQQYLENTLYRIINKELLGRQQLTICDPQDLLKLQFSDVLKFHKEIFTVTNCTIVTHGDMHPSLTINLFNQLCGQNMSINNLTTSLRSKLQPKIQRELPITIKVQHLESQIPLILSFMIDDKLTTSQQKVLLSILSYILFDMPQSPLMRWNTPETPYPKNYGYQEGYFNIGVTFNSNQFGKIQEQQFVNTEKEIRAVLEDLCIRKMNNDVIQRCLLHLQGSYYTSNGLKVVESAVNRLIRGEDLDSLFNVTNLISKLLRSYRKKDIFQSLLKKHILKNQKFIRIYGRIDPQFSQKKVYKRQKFLQNYVRNTLSQNQIREMIQFRKGSSLQNPNTLPSISVNQIQIFQAKQPIINQIKGVSVHLVQSERDSHIKLLFKFDITDLAEDDFNLLQIFCQAFPKMGTKSMKPEVYQNLVDKFIDKLQMTYETMKIDSQNLKVYLYLKAQFTQRNMEYGFNVINGLLNEFQPNNLAALSKEIQNSSSRKYNDISENLIQYHGLHLASSKSPFAQIQDPVFHSRSLCSLAEDILKVGNPKEYLLGVSGKFNQMFNKLRNRSRIEILVECSTQNYYQMDRYLDLVLGGLDGSQEHISTISTANFECENWMRYFPNYNQEICFQAFAVPYQDSGSAAVMVISSIINNNIKLFNDVGGCFLHKGALVSFIAGGRKKFIELEEYYKKIDDIDQAKRNIFQHFSKTNYLEMFRSGVSFQRSRQFKQAVIATDKHQVEQVLQQFILNKIQKGESSILALGEHLQNYQPLLKKGWQIQRSIQGTSLKMESLSTKQLTFQGDKFLKLSA